MMGFIIQSPANQKNKDFQMLFLEKCLNEYLSLVKA